MPGHVFHGGPPVATELMAESAPSSWLLVQEALVSRVNESTRGRNRAPQRIHTLRIDSAG